MAQVRTRTRKSTVAKTTSNNRARKQTSTDTKDLKVLVNKISEDMKLQKMLAARIKENEEKLETRMVEAGARLVETSKGVGEIYTPPIRASNSVDIKKFFSKVSKKDFFNTATVPMGKVKQVLSEKEVDKITITGHTTQKPDQLKVTPK